ncbi:hypothetical protein [Nereida sp. MMG025]|uniref:hypothetical protein n=1 Tax=Nereida sp. MMG025 TaxID=2909981 RepID=UPI001F469238|nr:hypothetical protein [Nereida sp. MMG025]MCF6444473.1 hypothetical protein [Nereida sp. MMG025]
MDFIPPYLAIALLGAVLAAVFLAAGHAAGLTRSRGAWVVTMIAIALFYVVFAVDGTHAMGFVFNASVATLFIGMAFLGYATTLWWVVAALVLHLIFDVTYHVFESNPAPHWWGPICLGMDGVLAAWLAVMLRRGVLHR